MGPAIHVAHKMTKLAHLHFWFTLQVFPSLICTLLVMHGTDTEQELFFTQKVLKFRNSKIKE
jgi:hypothetical protein